MKTSDKIIAHAKKVSQRPITSILSFCMVAGIAATITGFSQEKEATPPPAAATFPVQRTLTATDGRKLEATILEKSDTAVKIKTAAGKEFNLELNKLSADDQTFIAGCKAAVPIGKKVFYAYDNYNKVTALENVEELKKLGFDVTLGPERTNIDAINPDDYDIIWMDAQFYDRGLVLMKAADKLNRTVLVRNELSYNRTFFTKGADSKKLVMKEPYSKVEKNFIIYNDLRDDKSSDKVALAKVRAQLQEVVTKYHR